MAFSQNWEPVDTDISSGAEPTQRRFLFRITKWLWHPYTWIGKNQQKLFFLAGMLLVGGLAFGSGWLRGQMMNKPPLIIAIPEAVQESVSAPVPTMDITSSSDSTGSVSPRSTNKPINTSSAPCPFVGSRNSDKYHLATCAVAKRIKSENRVCFASKEEAEQRGYKPSCMK
ncbi:MAG: hypothetical protein ACSLEX_02945 [Minisyncoccota bacterium]